MNIAEQALQLAQKAMRERRREEREQRERLVLVLNEVAPGLLNGIKEALQNNAKRNGTFPEVVGVHVEETKHRDELDLAVATGTNTFFEGELADRIFHKLAEEGLITTVKVSLDICLGFASITAQVEVDEVMGVPVEQINNQLLAIQ